MIDWPPFRGRGCEFPTYEGGLKKCILIYQPWDGVKSNQSHMFLDRRRALQ